MKKTKLLIILLVVIMAVAGCNTTSGDARKLSFKSAEKYSELKLLDGQTVTINGYLATSSPADGSFIFLMNLPFQSCPFCVPNTSQLSNTIEVYPKKNDSFTYTSSAVKVTGTLCVAEEDNFFTDDYGYEFSFKIVDAEYKILKESDIAVNIALWNKIADSEIINDIYDMLDYIHFVSHWPTYSVKSYTDKDGNLQPGYYLWASDAKGYIETDGAQYNYGNKEGYFDDLTNKIKTIDSENLRDLIEVVSNAKKLAEKSINELNTEQYSYEEKYLEEFGTTDYVYTLNKQEELDKEYEQIYEEFSFWFTSWEL